MRAKQYASVMTDENLQVRLASRPAGRPTADNFSFTTESLPVPRDGQVLLRTRYLSLDPYMRGRMSDAPSYAPPVEVGGIMVGDDRRGRRVEGAGTRTRRRRPRVHRVAALRRGPRRHGDQARPRERRPGDGGARRARHAGLYRVRGSGRDREAEARGDRGGRRGERAGRGD